MSEDAVEKDRSNSGHAERAGVGEIDGDGDESRVVVGEVDMFRSGARKGLKDILFSVEKGQFHIILSDYTY